jgi:hypothetical protein
MKQLRHLDDIAAGRARYAAADIQTNLTFTVTADADGANIRQLLAPEASAELLFLHDEGATVELLEVSLPLPPIAIRVRNGQARLVEQVDAISEGDAIRMEIIPLEDFLMTYEFLPKNAVSSD